MRAGPKLSSFHLKVMAISRALTYPRLPYPIARFINYLWAVGPLGPNILLFILLIFTSFYCWINEWHYRPPFCKSSLRLTPGSNADFRSLDGSPPVAMRSEWIAVALLPFLLYGYLIPLPSVTQSYSQCTWS